MRFERYVILNHSAETARVDALRPEKDGHWATLLRPLSYPIASTELDTVAASHSFIHLLPFAE